MSTASVPGSVQRPEFTPYQSEKRAPCAGGCPNGADVRGWVGILAQHGRLGLSRDEAYERAWRLLVERNPFPATLGRICPHPCEEACNRTTLEGPVRVNLLERFLGDWALDRGLGLPTLEADGPRGSVAIIGAGPAGLSAAYQLRRRGHDVTVYDGNPAPGGMLRYGIPDYRLPRAVLAGEIRRIVALGVEIRCGVRVGREVPLPRLRDRHDAVLLAIGAQRARGFDLLGAGPEGVRRGIDYLRDVNEGGSAWCGSRVLVIGGGNTAVDAARTARRAGSEVTVLYRRTREFMPAFGDEVDAMLDEGVQLRTLVVPIRLERVNDRESRVLLQRLRMGEADGSGRPRPVPVPGALDWIPCDAVIAAVAQDVDWDHLQDVGPLAADAVRESDGWIGQHGLWAGGDVLGAGLASAAVGQGRRAAESIHRQLTGEREPERHVTEPAGLDDVVRPDLYEERPPAVNRDVHGRILSTSANGEAWPLREAARCMSCGLCFGCERCWMYCAAECFEPVESPEPGRYFLLDRARCEACGKCTEVCPTGYLECSPGVDARALVEALSRLESSSSVTASMV